MWIQKECQPHAKQTTAHPVKRIEITPAYDAILAENQHRLLSDVGVQLRIKSLHSSGRYIWCLKTGFWI